MIRTLGFGIAVLCLCGIGMCAGAENAVPGSTTIPFSFSVTATLPDTSSGGHATQNPQTLSGTMTPFGPVVATGDPDDTGMITFVLPSGASFSATLSVISRNSHGGSESGTIIGGTGVFTNATGSFMNTDEAVQAPDMPFGPFTFTIAGSGTIIEAGGGGISVLPQKLQIQAPQGSSAVVSNGLILNNQESTTVSFTASAVVTSKSDWLSVSPASGSVPIGSGSIQVTADPSGLAPGVYDGQVNLALGGNPAVVPVSLVVGSGGNLLLSETGTSFVAAFGGLSPADQTIQVTNIGAGTLTGLTAITKVTGAGPNWLHASIAPGFASQTTTPVSVTVDPGSLPAATYYGQVNFNLPGAANSPQSLSVQMQVNPAPPPTFTPAAVFMQTTVNVTGQDPVWGPEPPSQTVFITNPGLQNLIFTVKEAPVTAEQVAAGANSWFMFSPPGGSVGPGQTAQINISVTPNCLSTPSCVATVGFDNASGNVAFLIVNFPAINYSYLLQDSFGVDQVRDGNCPTTGPPCETYGGQSRPVEGIPPKASAFSPAAHGGVPRASTLSCNLTLLRGVFTSIPNNFQATVGQPVALEVEIFDNCGKTMDTGSVVATFPSGDADLVLHPLGSGQWAATWTPQNATANAVIGLEAVSPIGLLGALTLSGSVAASTATPIIDSGGVANAASGASVIAPGAFISIYGANLAGGTTIASTATFPDSLGSTEVFLGGESLPLYFTASGQIDAIVPYDINPNSSQQLIIQTGDVLSQPEPVIVATAQPGVFTQNQSGSGPGAILGQKPGGVAALNTASNPASEGDALLIYCTGLGTVTPAVTAGSPAPATSLSKTDNAVTVTVGGQDAPVLFAGLAPGFVGLYQVNVIVPTGIAAADDVPLILAEVGASSVPVTVAIH